MAAGKEKGIKMETRIPALSRDADFSCCQQPAPAAEFVGPSAKNMGFPIERLLGISEGDSRALNQVTCP